MKSYPTTEWTVTAPSLLGFSTEKLDRARQWMAEKSASRPYRFLVLCNGQIILEVNIGMEPDLQVPIASAAKSVYSNLLGIIVQEGKLDSADDKVVDYYPEMMEVQGGQGPKPGRYAFPKDKNITFRQLIANTSGYMKPEEKPGKVFHYQTYGMNILTHALAKIYGYYNVTDPEGSIGFGQLIKTKLADRIGTNWNYRQTNFDLHHQARLNIFGYYCQIYTTARDLARLGWLWCNNGYWQDQQIVPADWLKNSIRVSADLLTHSSASEWKYGLGFWTNSKGQLWPNLPKTGFTASGANGHYLTVFPQQGLVVVQNPGPVITGNGSEAANPDLLELVLNSLG